MTEMMKFMKINDRKKTAMIHMKYVKTTLEYVDLYSRSSTLFVV